MACDLSNEQACRNRSPSENTQLESASNAVVPLSQETHKPAPAKHRQPKNSAQQRGKLHKKAHIKQASRKRKQLTSCGGNSKSHSHAQEYYLYQGSGPSIQLLAHMDCFLIKWGMFSSKHQYAAIQLLQGASYIPPPAHIRRVRPKYIQKKILHNFEAHVNRQHTDE